jgi:hypothetical protein
MSQLIPFVAPLLSLLLIIDYTNGISFVTIKGETADFSNNRIDSTQNENLDTIPKAEHLLTSTTNMDINNHRNHSKELNSLLVRTYDRIASRPRIRLGNLQRKEQEVTLVDIEWLKTHEEVLRHRVMELKHAISKWKEYRLPLLVDCRTGSILDGHHRYHVGRKLGLSRLPVILVDYLEDDTIDVDVWPECGIDCLSKEDVIKMSLSDKDFPPKTSKHDFVAKITPISIPLSHLI